MSHQITPKNQYLFSSCHSVFGHASGLAHEVLHAGLVVVVRAQSRGRGGGDDVAEVHPAVGGHVSVRILVLAARHPRSVHLGAKHSLLELRIVII